MASRLYTLDESCLPEYAIFAGGDALPYVGKFFFGHFARPAYVVNLLSRVDCIVPTSWSGVYWFHQEGDSARPLATFSPFSRVVASQNDCWNSFAAVGEILQNLASMHAIHIQIQDQALRHLKV
jgi:hypothetical protein